MKKYLLILLPILVSFTSKGQLVVSAPDVTASVNITSAKQIATVKSIVTTAVQTNKILNGVKETSSKLLALTDDFQKALSKVNNVLATGKDVKEIFNLHRDIISLCFDNVNNFTGYLEITEAAKYRRVLLKAVEYNTNQLDRLRMFLKSDFYKMSDAERQYAINNIKEEMIYVQTNIKNWINVFDKGAQARKALQQKKSQS